DNVPGARGVDVIEHRGQRRRFAAAGRPGHQNETAWLIGDLADDRWELELLKSRNFGWNMAEGHVHDPPLAVNVDTEAADTLHGKRQIALHPFIEGTGLAVAHDAFDPAFDIFPGNGPRCLKGEVTVYAIYSRPVRPQMQVRRVFGHHRFQ